MNLLQMKNVVSFQGAWDNTATYSVANIQDIANVGLIYVSCPQVTYNGSIYLANDVSNQPTVGETPDSDDAWTLLATSETGGAVLGTALTGYSFSAGNVSATDTILQAFNKIGNVIATPLTGYASTSGNVSASSTILQAIEYLSFKSYLLLTGYAVASVANGALSFASVSATSKSSDITVSGTTIAIPLNKIFSNGQIKLNVTSAATSGATFTVTGANCTVVSETITVGASVTALDIFINFTVVSTATASPTISITASATTGTVEINNTSSVHLS